VLSLVWEAIAVEGSAVEPFGLGRKLVVLCWQQVIDIAHGLEKDIQPCLALDSPEDTAMLEPGMGENTMQTAEDVDEVLNSGALLVVIDDKPAREDLRVGHNVGSPIESVTAVVDGTAILGRLVHGTQELPLARTHFGARGCAARRGIEQEADDQAVALSNQEPAQLIQPQGFVHTSRRGGQ
jgi:hypothetical protein